MAGSPYHQISEQHTRRLHQWDSPAPVRLVTQHQQLLISPGAHNPWAAEAALEAHLQQRALAEIQDLEHRLLSTQKLSQDGVANQLL